MNRSERRRRRAIQHRRFPHIGVGATVLYLHKLAAGGTVEYYMRVEEVCPHCGCPAIVRLPPPLRDAQCDEDGTTHVCLPVIGGCNHGFAKEEAPVMGEKEEIENAEGK
jgi:hypothetical protein